MNPQNRLNRHLAKYFSTLETLRWLQNDPAAVHVVLTSVVGIVFIDDDYLKTLAFDRALGPIETRVPGDTEALRNAIDHMTEVPDFELSIEEQATH